MTSSLLRPALVLTVLAMTRPLAGQAVITAGHAAAIDDSVRQALAGFSAAMAHSHWDSAGAYYSRQADFRWVEEGRVVARSAGDIARYLATMKPTMRIVTTYSHTEITALAPGVAAVLTDFATTMTETGAAGVNFAGELTMVLVHEPDGWRILTGHSSAPH